MKIYQTRLGNLSTSVDVNGVLRRVQFLASDGVNGIFLDPSTKGVCDFISNINNYDWKAMGEKSYQIFLEKFTVKTMIDSYSSVINQLS